MVGGRGGAESGELVQWDLIAMIGDATSRLSARFCGANATEENMRLVWSYLKQYGRPTGVLYGQGGSFSDGREEQAG